MLRRFIKEDIKKSILQTSEILRNLKADYATKTSRRTIVSAQQAVSFTIVLRSIPYLSKHQ